MVIEVKREKYRKKAPLDLKQIHDRWFEGHLQYRYGGVVILDDAKPCFEVQVLSREEKNMPPIILSNIDTGIALPPHNFDRNTERKLVDELLESTPTMDVTELDRLVWKHYDK